ncbi:FAD-dependent oxidoreductase [Corynebacterium choanae]|uniref:Dihydrolipoyl dehydrogenase n=1 Tax=Corynebacterium choanae TaxID=1862358 RepID=A0A3G6JB98_9CORY|nr:FAD-dependent oxidoreductase [Corynebacterium choanae]AZA13900.1 Dihydrolipoyl dehydrogenase [Corynebacterium choanae]
MEYHVDVAVIGFGKAGKTIAMKRAKAGDKVVVIEQSPEMYGGTCINIGCVPTKTLLHQVREYAAAATLNDTPLDGQTIWDNAKAHRDSLIAKMNSANKAMVENAGATIVDGQAHFLDDHTLQVGDTVVTAETIIINTGAIARTLPVPGGDHRLVVDSTGIQQITTLPKKLVIIGGGPIGVEFASLMLPLGVEVTMLDAADTFLGRIDQQIAPAVLEHLKQQGLHYVGGAQVTAVEGAATADEVTVVAEVDGTTQRYAASLVLTAIGRIPATDALALENTSITVTDRGAIAVDAQCRTGVDGVYAVGDVTGAPQFTYLSFDDHRIVLHDRWGIGDVRSREHRIIPTTTFIDPPLSTVGKTTAELDEAGIEYTTRSAAVADIAVMPRPKIVGQSQGNIVFHIGTDDQILGATLWCVDSQEIINTVVLAMQANVPATEVGNLIVTHPSSSELLNGVLG